MQRRLLSAVLCLAVASSCSTAHFQPSRPVDCGGFFLSCDQDGVTVDQGEVRDALKAKPASASDERASEAWRVPAFVAVLTGASLITYKFVEGTAKVLGNAFGATSEPYDGGLFWVGVGCYVVGLGLGAVSRSYFNSAVDHYNASLKTSTGARVGVAPVLAFSAQGSGAGLALRLDF